MYTYCQKVGKPNKKIKKMQDVKQMLLKLFRYMKIVNNAKWCGKRPMKSKLY